MTCFANHWPSTAYHLVEPTLNFLNLTRCDQDLSYFFLDTLRMRWRVSKAKRFDNMTTRKMLEVELYIARRHGATGRVWLIHATDDSQFSVQTI